jgi:hypothetical protein
MPITSKMFPHEKLTVFTGEGEISYSETWETMSRDYRSTHPSTTRNVLWDLRNASVASITASQVTELANLSDSYSKQRGGGKTAVVVSQDINFGIAKEFEGQSMSLSREFVVFRDIDRAYKWIEESE